MTQMTLDVRLEMTCATHPGVLRTANEDDLAADPDLGFAVLADGMGGHNAGEIASRMAVAAVSQGWLGCPPGQADCAGDRHRALLERANADIYRSAQARAELAGMGTTVVSAYFHGDRLSVAHVGDSRLYRLRGARLSRLTRDHSVVQEGIDRGALTETEARRSEARNLLTRALGTAARVEVETSEFMVLPGDTYLLCSDGLVDMVEDHAIARVLGSHPDLPAAARHLVDAANRNGGRDNVSVILVRVQPGQYDLREVPHARHARQHLGPA